MEINHFSSFLGKSGSSRALENSAGLGKDLSREISRQVSRQVSRERELRRYFPGLSAPVPGKDNINRLPKNHFQLNKQGQRAGTPSFASLLKPRLSSEDIRNEVKNDSERKKLYNASMDFQALFIERMVDSMRKNLRPQDGLLYGGFRQKVFQDMLYEEYSRMLSRTDNFTLAEDIYRQARQSQGT